ncbi:MAG TPA: EscU/YscU/HrcU family type III secretion system export apparatus switch protein, partial [Verrucomicrobiae bacterium]
MSEASSGEKTEKPTAKRLEDAFNKGNIARSKEVQTVFVLGSALLALGFSGGEMWRIMAESLASMLGHLHDTAITVDAMQSYAITAALIFGHCVWPVLAATMVGGLLAGGIQTRFRTTSEALSVNWERLNPVEGCKRLFSVRSSVATGLGIMKL